LKSSVVIPDDYRAPVASFRSTSNALVGEFLAANPQLGASGVAAFCSGSGRYLQGLYVCYTPDGRPTACSAEIYKQAARSCGRPDFTVRSVR
jgi:ribonuclease T2